MQIVDIVDLSILTVDSAGNITYLNRAAEHLTGWTIDDSLGRPIGEIYRIFHEETCEPLENPLSLAMREGRVIDSIRPSLFIRRDGNEAYIENRASPMRDHKGSITGGVLVLRDVSDARQMSRRLSYFVTHDISTGIYNRRELLVRLATALKASKKNNATHALCYLNLDQFANVNELCGYSAGDTLLGELAALLKSKLRWCDTLARLGGDEFAVLLDGCSSGEAKEIAEALRIAVGEHCSIWDEREVSVKVSIGLTQVTRSSESVDDVLMAADKACRAAKQAGGDAVYAKAD